MAKQTESGLGGSKWALAIGAMTLLSACSPVEAAPEEVPPKPVVAAHVGTAAGGHGRVFSGTVRARDRAMLSFEIPGRVAAVRFDVGDTFEKGAVLARLDRQVHQLSTARSAAQLREAEATYAQAKLDRARQEALLQRNATPQAAVDDARSRFETSASRVEVARAALGLSEETLSDTVLRAPYAGVVAERLVEPSQNVSAGTPALRIQGLGGLEVVVDVPENLVPQLQVGSTHEVRLTALDVAPITGTITEIGADTLPGGTYPVYLTVETPPTELRSGASAEVALVLDGDRPDQVAIPLPAFLPTEGNRGVVFMLEPAAADEPGQNTKGQYVARKHAIELARLERDRAIVAEGLSGEELIVTRGLAFLRDGQHVTVVGQTPDRYGH